MALLADQVALWAIAARIGEMGITPNRLAGLGLNLVLLVNLAGSRPGCIWDSCADGEVSPAWSDGKPITCRSTLRGRPWSWFFSRRFSNLYEPL